MYPVALVKELGEDTVEELDLARGADDLVVDDATGVDLILDAVEQERMLTDLP